MLFDQKNPNKPKNLAVKFIYNFLSLQKQSQLGNTLAVGVSLGLIAVAGTTASLMKASKDKTNAVSDEMKKEIVAVGEGAVARFQNLFVQEPGLAVLNQKTGSQQWTTVSTATTDAQIQAELTPVVGATGSSNLCPGSPSETGEPSSSGGTLINKSTVQPLLKSGGVVNVSDGKSNWMPFAGDKEYRLISYDYNSSTNSGTLKLQSQSTSDKSKAQLSVEIPVKATPGSSKVKATGTGVPALWITDNATNGFGNNNFNGTIKISSPNCTFTGAMPVPGKTASENNGLITVVKSKESMPPTPNLPSTYYTNVTSVVGQTLPRTTDKADANGYYHYLIPSISLSGNNKFTVKANSNVAIYLQDDFSMSGNSTITVPNTSKLEIYGNTYVAGSGSKYKTGCTSATATGCQTDNVGINGGATTAKLFIHAPNALGGVNGGGNSNPNFSGSLWLRAWNGSSSNSGVLLGNNGTYGDYLGGQNRTVPGDPTITLGGISKFSMEEASN